MAERLIGPLAAVGRRDLLKSMVGTLTLGAAGGVRRSIAALDDGGRWVFEESGERFPFEEVEHYTSRRKRDRFTREMLARYLHHFGIELRTDAFLCVDATTPAVRLQQVTKIISSPEFTLDQVTAGLPWR